MTIGKPVNWGIVLNLRKLKQIAFVRNEFLHFQSEHFNSNIHPESPVIDNMISQVIVEALFYRYVGDTSAFRRMGNRGYIAVIIDFSCNPEYTICCGVANDYLL